MTTARQQPSTRRPTRTSRTRTLGVAFIAAVTSLSLAPGGHTSPAAADTDPPLVLIDQPFTIDPDGTLDLIVQLAGTTDLDDIVADGTVIVTSHRPLSTRTQVWDARNGSLPNVVDTIDIAPRAEQSPGPSTTATDGPSALVGPDGHLTIRVPTETRTRTADALQFAQPGIHPVVVEVRRADVTEGVLVTFVDRLGSSPAPSADDGLAVGLVIAPTITATATDTGAVVLDPAARAGLSRLADALAAVDDALAVGGKGPIPVMVQLDPSALESLAATDATGAQRLARLLGRVDLVATPNVPLDPSSAVAADQSLVYARLVDEGVEVVSRTTSGSTPARAMVVGTSPLSRGGAELLAATDTELVVLPYDLYASLDGSLGLFTDTSLAIAVDGLDLRAGVIDPSFAELLDEPGDTSAAAAIGIAAEIVLIADGLRQADQLDGHALLLATTDLDTPDPRLLGHVVDLLADARHVRLTSPLELADTLTTMDVEGRPVSVTLPGSVPPPSGYDPAVRGPLADAVRADSTAVASMLPDTDARRTEWATTADLMVSTIVTDDTAAGLARTIRAELDQIRGCVVPPERFSFTLTGRTSTIPFQIGNRCDVPVTVRVQLDSPKISFPDGEQLVELAPGTDTEVRARAVARTNGRSSVFLRLLTPASGGASQAVAPEVVLTARVQTLAGVGQLLFGTLVLVVAAWWLRHWRDTRRRAALTANAQHHPAARR